MALALDDAIMAIVGRKDKTAANYNGEQAFNDEYARAKALGLCGQHIVMLLDWQPRLSTLAGITPLMAKDLQARYTPTEHELQLTTNITFDMPEPTPQRAVAAVSVNDNGDDDIKRAAGWIGGLFGRGRDRDRETKPSEANDRPQPIAPREAPQPARDTASLFDKLSAGLDANTIKKREWTGDPRVPEKDRELYVTPPPVPDNQMVSALGSYLTDLLNARKQR